jgi:predicted PolB exonuclease-like 3'-5' exonuclease
MNIFVFDIETVPDIALGKKLHQLHDLSDEEAWFALNSLQREKNGTEFLPHYMQKIVAISVVWATIDKVKVWSLGTESSSEEELIHRFFAGLDKYTPTLVSWNGSGFDLPVLHYRALLHKITASRYWEHGEQQQNFKYNNYLSRYHQRHIDLMDVLAGYQPRCFAPLADIAVMLGFPGKMGMSGSQVYEHYLANDLSSIRNYCETDVLNTYCIYLRFELMRGNLLIADYHNAMEILKKHLLEDKTKPHLEEFALATLES